MAKEELKTIKQIPLSEINTEKHPVQLADCVILTHDGKILMQKRPEHWRTYPGVVCNFGGHIYHGEKIAQALVRELHEELGAIVNPDDIIYLTSVTEEETNHTEVIHLHFWHDKDNTVTGCYEAEAITFNNPDEALSYPKIMDYARMAIEKCIEDKLL